MRNQSGAFQIILQRIWIVSHAGLTAAAASIDTPRQSSCAASTQALSQPVLSTTMRITPTISTELCPCPV